MSGDCNVCINGKLPSYSPTCVACGLLRKNFKPQTNADRIRAMTDEELAERIMSIEPAACPFRGDHGDDCRFTHCQKCWLEYLKQEATNA